MVTTKGKIVEYFDDTQEGVIEDVDGTKYQLLLKNWREYSSGPQLDMLVRFINNKGVAIQIRLLEEGEELELASNEDKSAEEEISQEAKGRAPLELPKRKNRYDDETLNDKDDSDYSALDGIKYIPITRSYQDTFRNFFEDAIKVAKNSSFEDSTNNLDYALIRRFMITTFEHLMDKDPRFVNDDLLRLKRNLEDVYTIYRDLKQKLSNPTLDFDSIFLKDQEVYNLVKNKIENNNSRYAKLSSLSEDMESIIKAKEEKIKSLKGVLKDKEIDSIKKLRTRYVNAIDELSIIKEQNDYLNMIEKEFMDKHEIAFLQYFQLNSKELLSSITTIMNTNAYKFDTYLWKCAKESKNIKKFFIESDIDGSFSSRTFLRYYLSRLDATKMSKETFKLNELLSYLDSQDRKSILIVDDKSYMLDSLKYFANHIDNFFRAISMPPEEAKLQITEYNVDYIIINANINHINILEYISLVKKVKRDSNIEFILMGDRFKVDTILQVKKLGVNHFISTTLSEKRMYEVLSHIVLDSDEKEILGDKIGKEVTEAEKSKQVN
jgi:hypothetical protein